MTAMGKIYITGGSGVLGYELGCHFATQPDCRVQAVARSPLPLVPETGFAFEQHASLFDAEWLLPGDRDATVIHCAGLSNPRTNFNSFSTLARDHILPHVEMLETMLARGWRGRLIFPSSGGTVYGDATELPIRETHPTNPKSYYGLQKQCLENILTHMSDRSGFELVILRISNPFGSLVPKTVQGVIPILLQAFLDGTRFQVFGDGTAARDYIHMDDVCAAVEAAVRTALPERRLVLNIGSGEGVAINDLIATLGRLLGRRLDYEHVPVEHDVLSNVLCTDLAQARLNWQPRTPFAEGLKRLVDQVRVNPHR